MRETTRICDFCGQCILERGSVISLDAGELTKHEAESKWDVCHDCTLALLDFKRGRHPARQAACPDAPDARPVRLAAAK
jgi:hypothetical protein